MLKPALLYKEELQRKHVEHWYDEDTKYYSGLTNGCMKVDENDEYRRQFVSVDKDNNVIGYIAYTIDWSARSVSSFGMISYDKGNLEFVRDLYRTIYQIFVTDNFNRIEWWCFVSNPAVRGYKKFIRRFGGNIVGEIHQSVAFPDGSLQDSYLFEILSKDFDCAKLKRMVRKDGEQE